MSVKKVEWIGSSLDDLRRFPEDAQGLLGHELHRVQTGDLPRDWRPMSSVGAGVVEIRIRAGGAFRLLYLAKFEEAVYVLHVLQKKDEKTPVLDIQLARARYNTVLKSRRSTP